jgi:protein disulfide-isomerase
MKDMRALALAAVLAGGLVLAMAGAARAAELNWMTSYEKAAAASKQSGKPILADFTGSDWCIWCKRLDEQVFSTDEFAKWAAANVILLQLDFPQGKQLPDAIKQQNDKLMAKYGVDGFPTVLFLDADGKVLGQSGYMQGGPKPWIAAADKIINRAIEPKATLTEGLAAAKTSDKPLLVLLHQRSDADAATLLKSVVKKVPLIEFAEKYAEPVAVVASSAAGPATAEKKAVAALVAKAELPQAGLQLVLADSAGEKVLFKTALTAETDTAKLAEDLVKALPPVPYEGGWIEDYAKASLIARQQNKPMMLDFTGSDWCIWCQRLDKEIFSTDAFNDYAKANLVLVKLDFPRTKELDEATKTQNLALARKYQIRGFPTLVLLSSAGDDLGRMGYMQGGPDPFLKKLKETVAK